MKQTDIITDSKHHSAFLKRNQGNVFFFQPKLTINQPNDAYEKEADETADRVMRMNEDSEHDHFFKAENQTLQRKCAECEKEERLQRKNSSPQNIETDSSISSYSESLPSKGSPLPSSTRKFFESRFGYDFSSVKIHNDAEAAKSAQSVNALAYTVGNNIVFNKNQFQPKNETGKKLLAHELTHVVQQKSDSVRRKEIPEKNRDVDKMLKSAKMFWDDLHATFSYVSTDKISGTGYDKTQKEAINVEVSKGGDLDITFGDAFLSAAANERKSMIKTEVIDKYITVDRFEDLASDPTHSRLKQINPPYMAGYYCELNCPATAASLSKYLQSGTIDKAYCNPALERGSGYGFDTSLNTFSVATDWKKAAALIKKMLKQHGDFVVVEAQRSAKQMKDNNLTEYHYFTVVNVKGALFAIDAFGGGIVDDNIDDYVTNLKATSFGLLQGVFVVTPVVH